MHVRTRTHTYTHTITGHIVRHLLKKQEGGGLILHYGSDQAIFKGREVEQT